MNQKNVFTILAVLGVGFSFLAYIMGEQIGKNSFPELNEMGMLAVGINQELLAMVNLIVVFVMFASRENPKVLWAFTLGFFLLGLNSLKHLIIDDVNVPLFGIAMQWIITGLCAYLWVQHRKGAELATN